MNRNRRTAHTASAGRGTCPSCAKRAPLVASFGGTKIIGYHSAKSVKGSCYGVGLAPVVK